MTRKPPPYDHGWAWMVMLGAFLSTFMSLGIIRCYGILLNDIISRFQVSTAYGVIPITVVASTFACMSPICIILSEMFTVRKVVIFGSIFGFVGIALSSLLFNMPYFIITFGIGFGVGVSAIAGTGILLLTKYFVKRRSLANGIAMSGSSASQFVMPLFIEFLLTTYGLHGTLLLTAALFFHSLVSAMLYRPIESYDMTSQTFIVESRKTTTTDTETNLDTTKYTSAADKEEEPFLELNVENNIIIERRIVPKDDSLLEQEKYNNHDSEKSNNVLNSNSAKLTSSPRKKPRIRLIEIFDFRVLKRVDSVLIMLVAFFCFFGLMSFMVFLPAVLREKGYMTYKNASLISVMGVGDLIGRIGTGFVADLKFVKRFRMQATAALLAGIGVGACYFVDSYIGLIVLCALYGVFSGGFICLFAPVVLDTVGPERMAKNYAIGTFLQGLGSAIGQPLLGAVKDATGSYSVVLLIICLITVTGSSLLHCYPMVARLDKALQKKKHHTVTADTDNANH